MRFIGHLPNEASSPAKGRNGRRVALGVMDQIMAVAALNAVSVCWRAWARDRGHHRQEHEDARCDLVRQLPRGSRIIDLGKRGMVIEVGSGTDRELPPDDTR